MAFSFQAIRFDFELTFYQPAPAYAMHTSNKTENPSKDALDKTENYANCDQTDQGDQTYRTDQGDKTNQIDQTSRSDWGDHWPDWPDWLDEYSRPLDRTREGWCENCQTWEIANL